MKDKWLIIGLGNPGSQYEGTPHNVGFMIVDCLVQKKGLSWRSQKNFLVAGSIASDDIVCLKPMTYMNLSGQALASFMGSYKDREWKIVVVVDNIDLSLGVVRWRYQGSHAGHNGIKSIMKVCSQTYRVWVGVGRQGNTTEYVLRKFNKSQCAFLEDISCFVSDQIMLLPQEDFEVKTDRYSFDS